MKRPVYFVLNSTVVLTPTGQFLDYAAIAFIERYGDRHAKL